MAAPSGRSGADGPAARTGGHRAGPFRPGDGGRHASHWPLIAGRSVGEPSAAGTASFRPDRRTGALRTRSAPGPHPSSRRLDADRGIDTTDAGRRQPAHDRSDNEDPTPSGGPESPHELFGTPDPPEKQRLYDQVSDDLETREKDLESHQTKKLLALFEAQDEIESRKESLIGGVEARSKQTVEVEDVFTIGREVV